MSKKCIKCGYVRDDEIDKNTPDYECPRCGVIYAKAKKKPSQSPKASPEPPPIEVAPAPNKNLIPCPECNSLISKKAKFCPNCGVNFGKHGVGGKKFHPFLIAAVILLCLYGYNAIKPDKPAKAPPTITEAQKRIERKKVESISIVDIEKRHTAEHPIKIQRLTLVDENSTIENILIKGRSGVQFYTTDVYEKYNLFKFVVLYFWYYTDRDSVRIKYETNKGDYKKILVYRRHVEELTGDLNQVTRKQVGDIRYDKQLANKMFSSYVSIK
jgi:DNA-directed RNA polymerase subunit RPC12/RpoP